MKTIIFKAGMAMSLCIATLATACSDKITESDSPLDTKVPLEISVEGINKTRSIITGTMLPDTCEFAVFYDSPYSVKVDYRKGKCTLNTPIILGKEQRDIPVYAVYPYVPGIEVDINTSESQIDYRSCISVDPNRGTFYPYAESPKASIVFNNVLARVTINIHKDASIDQDYKLPDIFLGGDDENAYRSAMYLPSDNYFEYWDNSPANNIKGELKDGNYLLDTPEDMITVDFLVIPSTTTWQLNIRDLSDAWYSLPATKYESGKQYIFDCVITDKEPVYLQISECEIRPWETTEMPELETY